MTSNSLTTFLGTSLQKALVLLLVPVLVAGGMLWATWGAGDRLSNVQAAVVNLDEGAEIDGQPVPLGRQLTANLVDGRPDDQVSWEMVTEEEARDGLETGRYAAMVIIPPNFSESALSFSGPPEDARQATMELTVSPLAGVADGLIARNLADEATVAFNQFLTEDFLDNIFIGFNDMGDQMGDSVDAARQLADGSEQLAGGVGELDEGAQQLAEGMGQLRAPGEQLTTGGSELADGADQLSQGLQQLADGTAGLPAQGQQLADGIQQLDAGMQQLAQGSRASADGAAQYNQGVTAYTGGVDQLSTGLEAYAGGAREFQQGLDLYFQQTNEAIPLEEIAAMLEGLDEFAVNGEQLAIGLNQLADRADSAADQLEQLSGQLDGLPQELEGAGDELRALIAQQQGIADGSEEVACPAAVREELGEAGCAGFEYGARANAQLVVDMLADADLTGLDALLERVTELAAGVDEQLSTAITGLREIAAGARQFSGMLAGMGDIEIDPAEIAAGMEQLQAAQQQLLTGAEGLATGAEELSGGASELSAGSEPLRTGGTELANGLDQLADGADQAASGSSQLNAGGQVLATGMTTLSQGISQTATGGTELSTGLRTYTDGVGQYVEGVNQSVDGVDQFVVGIQELRSGADQIADGNRQFAEGLEEGIDAIPTYSDADRETLTKVVTSPVNRDGDAGAQIGAGWASLLVALGLWLGAMVTARLGRSERDLLTSNLSNGALLWQSLRPGLLIGAVQALLVGTIAVFAIDVTPLQAMGVVLVSLLASVTYVTVNRALSSLLGGWGTAIAVAIAVVGVGAALTASAPGFFHGLAPMLPFDPALEALRAAMTSGSGLPVAILGSIGWMILGVAGSWLAIQRKRQLSPGDLSRVGI